ncbi:7-cyano-7-deazaguanine reductase [Pseudidiomarina salinarum]|uniref:NADPH-dependent 7-cyano-7-deazaguanine reductase n=1 Tax=Pseudidiomarina salinarum TaxID=435908 RepID=A0A094J0V8_9GAMM|nr:NADPH-dependent 7-cyano-7-deazaguanine reductase QueF [Pseudidiomarina salinarum]KFZ31694.1 7-cyano-7-deazaguanine reductase [Pseudidiomarina salinarum]RUO70535.1 preQ(1) synthase [Pseudidiomarina salinarum]
MKQPLGHLSLGRPTDYPTAFDAGLLQAVPRQLNRSAIGLNEMSELPFQGQDYWTGYELSWLNARGMPQVAVGEFVIPATSPSLVESKSFKLYLNSFNNCQWADWDAVRDQLQQDLSACAGATVQVKLLTVQQAQQQPFTELPGDCLDNQDIAITEYDYNAGLLAHSDDNEVTETLHSHLLKSNCLITNQPDWGSVMIRYRGKTIDRAALLRYIVSFRHHNEFHEQCVERLFVDLKTQLDIKQLTVYARYTRRGGLDINPFRSDFETAPAPGRLSRQ